MIDPHETQQEAQRSQLEHLQCLHQRQAEQGLLRSSLAAQQQPVMGLAGLGGIGTCYGNTIQNPHICGIITGSPSKPRRKPIISKDPIENYSHMYGGDFVFEWSDISEAVKAMITSNTSKQLLKGVITFLVMYLIITAAIFGCSELYEYFSLLDV